MKTSILASALTVAVAITGCVSIEDQLNSQDPSVRLDGEYRLLTQARMSGKSEEVVNAVKRIQTKPFLLAIAKNARRENLDEGKVAISKLTDEKDFATLACSALSPLIRHRALAKVAQQETLLTICTQAGDPMIRKSAMDKLSADSLTRLPYSTALLPYWKKISDQKTLAKIYRDGCRTFSGDDLKAIAEKIDDEAILGEMVLPPDSAEVARDKFERNEQISNLDSEIKDLRKKIEECNKEADYAKSNWAFSKERRLRHEAADLSIKMEETRKRLAALKNLPPKWLYVEDTTARIALCGRIRNAEILEKLLKVVDDYNKPLLKTSEQLVSVFKRMPEDKALGFALEKLRIYDIYDWKDGNFWPLKVAASLAGVAKDSKTRVRLADAAFGKIESIRAECRNSFNFLRHWGDYDKSTAAKYAAEFPLSEDEKVEILVMGSLAGSWVAEIADENVARKALTSGRTLDEKIEKMLVAKIPGEKIDLALYESVKSEVAKDALYEKMPDSVKESINTASATQEATASNKPSVKVSVGDVNIANINMDDVVAAIKTWQKERWNANRIVAIRKSKGRVAVDDLKLSAHYKGIQPFLDIMIADYIIYVNVLDSFVDAQTPKDAVAMLLKSLSMDDILKMAKDLADAVDSAKSIKDNAGWRDVVPIGKDMVTIYAVSSSMTNASGILKGIFDKLMSR